MNRYRRNSETLYLRPIEYQPDYQIKNAAKWLWQTGKFKDYNSAIMFLIALQEYHPYKFKSVMAQYYDATEVFIQRTVYRDVNTYKSTDTLIYGDEPHMYY